MIRRMLVVSAAGLVAAAFVSAVPGAQVKPAPDVAGRWALEAADGPHGPMVMTLVLEQKGRDVSGTLNVPHAGDLKMTGTFDAGKLTMASDPSGEHHGVTLTATLKESSLAGYISSERGDVKWIGKRK